MHRQRHTRQRHTHNTHIRTYTVSTHTQCIRMYVHTHTHTHSKHKHTTHTYIHMPHTYLYTWDTIYAHASSALSHNARHIHTVSTQILQYVCLLWLPITVSYKQHSLHSPHVRIQQQSELSAHHTNTSFTDILQLYIYTLQSGCRTTWDSTVVYCGTWKKLQFNYLTQHQNSANVTWSRESVLMKTLFTATSWICGVGTLASSQLMYTWTACTWECKRCKIVSSSCTTHHQIWPTCYQWSDLLLLM